MRKFRFFWRCPLFWTILSEKISLFKPYGFMVYSACPSGASKSDKLVGESPGQEIPETIF